MCKFQNFHSPVKKNNNNNNNVQVYFTPKNGLNTLKTYYLAALELAITCFNERARFKCSLSLYLKVSQDLDFKSQRSQILQFDMWALFHKIFVAMNCFCL